MDVPHFNISLPNKTLDIHDLHEIVKLVRPEWCLDHATIEDLSSRGGVNINVICRVGDARIFIRVNNTTMHQHFTRQLIEGRKCVAVLGLSAGLICTFTNGFVEECIDGEAILQETKHRVYEPDINKAIADEMAKFHSRSALKKAYESNIEVGLCLFKSQWLLPLWEDIKACSRVEVEVLNQLPGPADILRETADVSRALESLGSEMALCHWDLNPANMVVQNDGRVFFVDYETLAIDYPAVDLAGFFLLSNFEPVRNPNDDYPGEDYRHQFYRNYLAAKRQYDNASDDCHDITESELKNFDVLVSHGKLLSLLVFIVYLYMLYTNQLTFELPVQLTTATIKVMWKTYFMEKELLGLT